MRVEAPLFKRCLCCLPLRYGLLTIGYLKLLIGILLLLSSIIEEQSPVGQSWPVWFTAFNYFENLIVVCDTALTVVFVIGCHKKNVKLLKIYNNFSIGCCIASTLMWLAFFFYLFSLLPTMQAVKAASEVLKLIFILGLLFTCFDVYLIFLTRSEILKLENSTQFSFSNNANEAECAMVNDTHINLTKPTFVNDNDEREVPEISVDDNNAGQSTQHI